MPTKKEMNDAVKIALISAVCSVITALITASVQWKAAESQERTETKVEAKQADETLAELPAAGPGTVNGMSLRTLSAKVDYKNDGKTRSNKDPSDGFLSADICVLTSVSTYGGASKSCNLSRTDDGWSLVATGRKATVSCKAVCFDLSDGN